MFDRLSNASTMRLYGESFDKVSTNNNNNNNNNNFQNILEKIPKYVA